MSEQKQKRRRKNTSDAAIAEDDTEHGEEDICGIKNSKYNNEAQR